MMRQPKLVLFASGSGTNAEKIMQQVQSSGVAQVSAVYCNNSAAGVIERAERLLVPVRLFENAQLNDPNTWDNGSKRMRQISLFWLDF